jgi:hypothetical protein
MKSTAVDHVYDYFQRIDREPPELSLILPLATTGDRRRRLIQRIEALRLPVNPLEGSAASPIELVIIAAAKDFNLLKLSVESVLANGGSPITRVTLVVPTPGIPHAESIATGITHNAPIEVVSEDDLISPRDRELLGETFGSRYGWILQQFLCIASVVKSNAGGVLVQDADTALLRSRVLLSGKQQLLMSSLELHRPYFDFLSTLSPHFSDLQGSHVTHHMLQQPEVSRRILAEFCGGDLSALVSHVVRRHSRLASSAVCIDYELYAQGLLLLYPERVIPAKWSNVAVPRAKLPQFSNSPLSKKYCSASFHDYLTK